MGQSAWKCWPILAGVKALSTSRAVSAVIFNYHDWWNTPRSSFFDTPDPEPYSPYNIHSTGKNSSQHEATRRRAELTLAPNCKKIILKKYFGWYNLK